jgi:DnaJ-like protein
MGGGKAFVEVLDEVLGEGPRSGFQVPGSDVRVPGSGFGVATYPFFWFEQGLKPSAQRQVSHQPIFEAAAPPPPRRPRRSLSAKHQQALEALVALGARIDADFTDDELRRAFRGLALRYHPDRHPASTNGEKVRLSGLFAQACDAYEDLKTVPHTIH